MDHTCKSISDIEVMTLDRFTLAEGMDSIDWIYGYTRKENGLKWGIPRRMISLWSGSSGVGKSRVAVKLAKVIAKAGHKVLYVQNEMPAEYFAGTVKNIYNPHNFICSTASSIDEIVEDIKRECPSFVIIDSVNEIDEFETGNKRESRLIINALREVVGSYTGHIILLGQLNQDGTIKGGTSLPHLVDIAVDFQPYDSVHFIIRAGIKNRCGKVGGEIGSYWKHLDHDVECVQCDYDETWNRCHGVSQTVAPKGVEPQKVAPKQSLMRKLFNTLMQ